MQQLLRQKFFLIFGILCLTTSSHTTAAAAERSSTEQQLQELKASVETLRTELETIKNQAAPQQPLGARVGGHLKFYTYDKSQGENNGVKERNNSAAGLSSFYLFIDKDISDKVSISVYPEISVRAGATPSLGKTISRTSDPSPSTEISQAFIKAILPNSYELRVGMFKPVFSEEYANHIWWDEQYNANKGVNNLQSWSDSGIEVFKNFDFNNWTLAAHGYLLNGENTLADNNNSKSILLHLSPEISNIRLMGSIGYGKWDDNGKHESLRYAYGTEWKHGGLTLRGEYLGSRTNTELIGTDQVNTAEKGYYLKTLYRFNPKWRALAVHSRVSLPDTSGAALRKDKYTASTLGLNFFVTDSSVIIGELTFVDAERSDNSQKLEHSRLTIGMRTTF